MLATGPTLFLVLTGKAGTICGFPTSLGCLFYIFFKEDVSAPLRLRDAWVLFQIKPQKPFPRAETQRRREKQNHELGALSCAVHAKGRLCQGSLLFKTAEMPFPCNTKLQLVCQPPLRGLPDASSFAGGASLYRCALNSFAGQRPFY